MSKLKQEVLYRTSDGKAYYGKNAMKRAKEHQGKIDLKRDIKELLPEVYNILGIDKTSNNDDEENIVEEINEMLDTACDDAEELLYAIADIHFEIPALVKIFNLIDRRFDEYSR